MPLPPGHNIRLSVPRRLMCDMMHFSKQVPVVAIERVLDLKRVVSARQALSQRPSWYALFLKAFGLVAQQHETLRRSYLSFPWPHLHQHACNVASLPIERRIGDEDGVLFIQIRNPEQRSLWELDAIIRNAKTAPLESIGDFNQQLLTARLPLPLRRLTWWMGLNVSGKWHARYFGTYGVTGVASLGSTSLHFISPLTSALTYGIFEPDGTVTARLAYDHRVMDGTIPAKAMEELEKTFRGPIVNELGGSAIPSTTAA